MLEDFYVYLRSRTEDVDASLPVTATNLESLGRLAEASARIRLSDTTTTDDVERVTELVEHSLNVVESDTDEDHAEETNTGLLRTHSERLNDLLDLIEVIEKDSKLVPRERGTRTCWRSRSADRSPSTK